MNPDYLNTARQAVPVPGDAPAQRLLLWDLNGKDPELYGELVQLGHAVVVIRDPVEANERLREQQGDVVLLVPQAAGGSKWLGNLEQLINQHPHSAWIALLHDNWQKNAALCGLLTRAFFDFHTLPAELMRLRVVIGHAFGMLELRRQVEALAKPTDSAYQLIGDCEAMLQLKRQIGRVASAHNTVLIQGESGTGKELVARAIHQTSPRRDGPFEALNCAALPATLIQTELFGHEKGAYTDAHQRTIGRFEACHGGTLFLDEIGDMPLEQQVNLLRVLEQGCVRRIGGSTDIPIDVRVVTATHIDLEQAVTEGKFREDLYYRINVLKLHIPPLRERNEDIELLARYFLNLFRHQGRQGPRGFSQQTIETMCQYHWPGNVRELINRVQHAVVMADGTMIMPEDLGIERRLTTRTRLRLDTVRAEAESQAIRNALHLHKHNITDTAAELGISRMTLYRLLEKYAIASRPS